MDEATKRGEAKRNETKAAAQQVVAASEEEWLAARMELLAEEKALSKQMAALAQKRSKMPLRPIDNFRLDGPDGPTTLSALFNETNQLIVYHLMMGEDAKEPCSLCSFFIEGVQGGLPHLLPRASFAVVAKASFRDIAQGTAHKGWDNVPLYSSANSSFGEALSVSFTPEQEAAKNKPYNYGRQWQWGKEAPGLSVFKKDASTGAIYHTYSTYSAGLGTVPGVSPVLTLLDLTPEGRAEGGGRTMWWVKH